MKKVLTPIRIHLPLLLIMSLLSSSNINAQNNYKNKPDKRFFVGGNFGLQFGTVTLIDVSPLVGYRLTENLAAGIGGTYQYFKDKRIPNYTIETDIYGGKVFARYYFITENFLNNLFIHTEYEFLNLEAFIYFPYSNETARVNVPIYFIGGGIQQPISSNSYVTLAILWDLIEDLYSPYVNPVIRMGVNFGI